MSIIRVFNAIVYSYIAQFFPLPGKRNQFDFIFLAHPRNLKDIYIAFSFLKNLKGKTMTRFLLYMWPLFTSVLDTGLKKKDGTPLRGRFITISATPEMILRNSGPVRKKIHRAVLQAKHMGAGTVGLGALLPAVVAGEKKIIEPQNVSITTGYGFSVLTVMKNIRNVSELFNIDLSKATVGMVGPSQKIGYHVARAIGNDVREVILYDQQQKKEKLDELISTTEGTLTLANSQDALKKAHIILVFTNARALVLQPENITPGTIIIDDTQPNAVPKSLADCRDDILILDGGLVNLPGFNPHFRFGLLHREDMWGCLAETLILSWLKDQEGYEYTDFSENEKKVTEAYERGYEKAGFRVAPMRGFSRYRLKEETIEKIQNLISEDIRS